jgi:hypothetical protein
MTENKIAVGVGYCFTVVHPDRVKDIALKKTATIVEVNGDILSLYKASDFEESKKVDALLDATDTFERDLSAHIRVI